MRYRFGRRFPAVSILLALPGCARPTLIAGDAIVQQRGDTAELAAFVEHRSLGLFTAGVANTPVQFFFGNREVRRARTDGSGCAGVVVNSAPDAERYTARTRIGDTRLQAAGAIFEWNPDCVVIAIDLDETICATDYLNLLWGDGQASPPCAGSVEALNALANDFHILYYSARPRLMMNRTRRWLSKSGFPPGPIVFSANISAAFEQGPAKRRLLADLRKKWPNVLLGIGDRYVDVQCCAPNHMLPIIVNPSRPSYRENAVVVPDWKSLLAFFEAHRGVLTDSRALAQTIERGERLVQPSLAAPATQGIACTGAAQGP